jgi:hypothetical protein
LEPALALSRDARLTAAVLLLALVTVESGGLFMLRVVTARAPATPFQTSFFRAGHAHAGVLVILSLVCLLFLDATRLTGIPRAVARSGVPAAAILMPGGFFLSALGAGRTRPGRAVILVYLGAVCLAAGLLTLGIGLLVGG